MAYILPTLRNSIKIEAHSETLRVLHHSRGTYFARIGTQAHARWGNTAEIREDIEHFLTYGTLPHAKVSLA